MNKTTKYILIGVAVYLLFFRKNGRSGDRATSVPTFGTSSLGGPILTRDEAQSRRESGLI